MPAIRLGEAMGSASFRPPLPPGEGGGELASGSPAPDALSLRERAAASREASRRVREAAQGVDSPRVGRRVRGLVILLVLGLASAALLASPAEPPDISDRCYPCHDEVRTRLAGEEAHDPVQRGQCGACHNPHAARHEHLLVADEPRTCGRCHEGSVADAALRFVHTPFRAGECTRCHSAHSAPRDRLLREAPEDLCLTCHPPDAVRVTDPAAHQPVRERRCLACHDAHASSVPGVLAGPPADLCSGCHAETDALRTAHGGFSTRGMDCTVCHRGHASDGPNLLRANLHDPVARLQCGACHVVEGGALTDRMVSDTATLCFSCHGDRGFTERVRHGPVASGDCLACHDPHAAENDALLPAAPPDLCRRCHEEPPATHAHAPVLDGRCLDCHEVHSSPHDSLTRERKWIELCEQCHERHPHSVDVVPSADIRVADGSLVRLDDRGRVACLSCHAAHGAEHEPLVYYDRNRDLCVQCHSNY